RRELRRRRVRRRALRRRNLWQLRADGATQPSPVTADTTSMRSLLIVASLLAAVPAPARAGGIALEAYTGERPPDAARLVSPILDELAARGFSAGDTIARSYEGKISRAAETPSGLPADF